MKTIYLSIFSVALVCFAKDGSFAQSNHQNPVNTADTCVTLRSTQSAYLETLHPSANSDSSHELDAIAWTVSGTPVTWRSVFNFNFDTIPANATIVSATLSLYGDSNTAEPEGDNPLSGSNAWVIDRVTSAWNGNTVSWNTQPSYTPVDSVQMPECDSIYGNFTDINVKTLVQDIVNNSPNEYGFMLKLDTESYYRSMVFCSMYYPEPARRPKLNVCYLVPTGIANISDNAGLSIYPNPASSNLTIDYTNSVSNPVIYKIYNTLGMLVKQEYLPDMGGQTSMTINIKDLAAGIYLLQLNNGSEIMNAKFVKL